MSVLTQDYLVLRELAQELAEIAALPVMAEKRAMWTRLNGLQPVKPMVNICQLPWHELDVDNELTTRSTDDFCRKIEVGLRRKLYQWRHMPVDMVIEPLQTVPLVIHDTGFGISEDVDIVRTDGDNDVVSRHFNIQIRDEADLEKIKMPQVSVDWDASAQLLARNQEIFDGVLPVAQQGIGAQWFAPWDELVRWWGVQEALEDMLERPELVHKGIDRLVSAYLHRLDQYEQLNLLALNNVGDGPVGYSDELPGADYDPAHVRAHNQWTIGAAQIFSEVSPAMHDEFALQYELRWYRRFGLNYYGCCEPLHRKIDVISQIPNLRKISMSPWVNLEQGAENIGNRYVFSRKPNPAVLATDVWHLDNAREDLELALEATQRHGCIVEVILKDISTVRYEPQRVWEWAAMADEVTARYAQ
ncbi:MAG TPA: hypothetical protein VGL77_00350 [Armatimonadota bacterium]|jgi:hypothetical protein